MPSNIFILITEMSKNMTNGVTMPRKRCRAADFQGRAHVRSSAERAHAGGGPSSGGSHYHTAAAVGAGPTDPGAAAAAGISPTDSTDGSNRHTGSALLPFRVGQQPAAHLSL